MKIYFASIVAAATAYYDPILDWHISLNKKDRIKLLFSYWYMKEDKAKKIDLTKIRDYSDNILDSGAFSAWNIGAEITVEQYLTYIEEYKYLYSHIFNLDVIGNFKASMRNQEVMENHGIQAIPVFHMSAPQESYDCLKYLCEKYDYIALGGIAGKNFSLPQKKIHLDKCWQIISQFFEKGKRVKVHGFGITGQFLLKYPFYSADSSSWASTVRYGTNYKFDNTMKSERSLKEQVSRGKIETATSLLSRDVRLFRALKEFQSYEKYLTNLWKLRGIEWS